MNKLVFENMFFSFLVFKDFETLGYHVEYGYNENAIVSARYKELLEELGEGNYHRLN